ncbi:general transcription factor II-I repeat domain-containing protein 2A [Nephila pilipes]|uniref:General transcription factor II-I repeat domain-containing protein 2A n=1 Tax=Nephila pilipes TaxID=299642 RepID=A0A8X6N9L5_NEPPI|nr:general transcription factor II-I repeat domain-containing protein 2A [Nephila pilipes]
MDFELCIFHRYPLSHEQLKCPDLRKNLFIDFVLVHLKSLKLKLDVFARQLVKNDLSHFPSLNSTPSVNKDKSYKGGPRKLYFEFEHKFEDFNANQTELDIFSAPFNITCEAEGRMCNCNN